ncbi:MAG: hypothetical protein HKN84_12485 [Gammaproteobacteria bacterium]|nr:hypothetical protein [Gammaproteobacteria bacterium]
MNVADTHQIAAEHSSHVQSRNRIRATDTSGYVVFSNGGKGSAHVMAHRMLDQGQIVLGHDRLGAWLEGRTGSGSDWAHLQFHMAIFELGIGDWDAAYERFLTAVLPVAQTTEDALTDGPGLLWRLAITAPAPINLPWEVLRQTALRSICRIRDPFIELHHLLAFAGAGDRESIDSWLRLHTREIRSERERLVIQAGVGLRAYADRSYGEAGIALRQLAPYTQKIGGSRAQNELFKDLAEYFRRLAERSGSAILYRTSA